MLPPLAARLLDDLAVGGTRLLNCDGCISPDEHWRVRPMVGPKTWEAPAL